MARPKEPWQPYVRDVQSGKVVCGELVRLAVERHQRDLETGVKSHGFRFDRQAAYRPIHFIEQALRHSKGEWAGGPLLLSPWQKFVIASLFGWKNADGSRRYRTGYVEIARKNGKSTLAAAIGLYLMVADGEAGAEVYSAATTRDQADIVWSEARRMAEGASVLKGEIRAYETKHRLIYESAGALFARLSSDANTLDGLNIHGAIIDELHAHADRKLWDVLETGIGSRRNPLILGITTAGQESESLCGTLHTYADQVLRGIIRDDGFFAYVACLDEGDDWADPNVWPKANPNLNVSIYMKTLEAGCQRAKNMRSYQAAFRRLHVNQWMQVRARYIDMDQWDACAEPVDAGALQGQHCYAGLDLASRVDLCALVLVFPPQTDDQYRVLCRFYMPEEQAENRVKARADGVPYPQWVQDQWIQSTPGGGTDYAWIRSDLEYLSELYEIRQLGYDPWNATQLTQEIESEIGVPCVEVRQIWRYMSPPLKELERLLVDRQIAHGGQPVLRWMADNLVVRMDPAGNVVPDRDKSPGKIDGMVALAMALDRCLRREGAPQSSVYERRGVRYV